MIEKLNSIRNLLMPNMGIYKRPKFKPFYIFPRSKGRGRWVTSALKKD